MIQSRILLRDPPHSALVSKTASFFSLGAVLTFAAPAFAAPPPTPRECAAASEESISLRKDGKLSEAKDRLLLCADTACPAEIRDDCARHVTEVSDALPSVVFEVKDAAGNDIGGVKVSMDGALLIEHLGGASVNVNPGEHTFRFEGTDPSQAVEKKFVIREAEKSRHLAVVMASPAKPGSPLGGRKTLALVAGGAGVVGLGLGVTFGFVAMSSWNSAKSECGAGCPADSVAQSSKSSASSQAAVSTAGIIVGGVLVAGAAVLWFTAPSGAQVQVGPTASAQGGGLSIHGTF